MQRLYLRHQNAILCIVALFVGMAASELIARLFVPVRNVGPSFTIYDAYCGKALKKDFSAVRITPEFRMTLTTNSKGFRGPELEPFCSRLILFIGDSFTMGYGVNDGEEYPAIVRNELNKSAPEVISVVNAGLGNSGNGRWVKFLRTEGKSYDPSLIVLQIHENDFMDNSCEGLFDLNSEGELIELPVPSPGVMRTIQWLVESVPGLSYSYLVGLARELAWRKKDPYRDLNGGGPYAVPTGGSFEEELSFRLLEEVLKICDAERWKVLAVLACFSGERLEEMEQFFSRKGVRTVCIPNRSMRPDLYYRTDGHWNKSGHGFTACRILDAIKEMESIEKIGEGE